MLIANLLLIVLIYYWVTSKLTKSIAPIVQGIQGLVTKNNVYVKEKGPLSELAMNINQTSQTLQSQERVLKREKQQELTGLQVFRMIFAHHFLWLWGTLDN